MKKEEDKKFSDDSYLQTIADMIKDIQYGSVNIIVQDGKIVQVEKTEKHRIRN